MGPESLLEEEMGKRDARGEDLLRGVGMFYSKYLFKQKKQVGEGAGLGSSLFLRLVPGLCAFLAPPLDEKGPFPAETY